MKRAGKRETFLTIYKRLVLHFETFVLQHDLELCSKMWQEGLGFDVLTCSALLEGFCKGGMIQETQYLFTEMTGSGLTPDAITYNIFIEVYCVEGNSQEVFVCLQLK